MKQPFFVLLAAAGAAFATAQTPTKPAAPAAAAKPASTAAKPSTAPVRKYPPGVHPAPGIPKTAFALQYQDLKIGTGAEAEPGKIYKVNYTGWRAKDGVIFDSSLTRRTSILDNDGKPEMDADGKPKLGEPHAEPISFPQGAGRLIPGWDQGFYGMKIGGKRRLFIPWQLGYANHEMPDRGAGHPGIPAKSDLIFDVELVDVSDLPPQAARPGMMGRPMPQRPGTPSAAPAPGTTPAPSTAPAPSSAPAPAAAAPSQAPPPAGTPPPQPETKPQQ